MMTAHGDMTLRLVWPQWQGAGSSSIRDLAPEFPFDVARRGYAVGSAVLAAVLPPHDGPTAVAPVAMGDDGLDPRDGIEAKDTVDSNEIVLGLGAEPDGLTGAQVRRIVADLGAAADVVGLTIAEFIPRQVMHLRQMLAGFPLLGGE